MPRPISASLRELLQRQESGEAVLFFVTLDHPDLAEPVRVVCDGVDYVWQGETWIGFPFDIELLSDGEGPPRAQMTIQNVDRSIGDTVRDLTGQISLRMEIVAASEFDQTVAPRVAIGTPPVEYSASNLRLANVSVDALQVTGDIVSYDYSQDTYPARRATQDRYPALFR
ncbi:DUF1833 family protein [Xanthobacter autotrophicus]|uniref:DUF1833 family protein n=1 Tax=Xanthobacter autotrophicus TaxID=280 RepID=UPI00372AF229